MRAAASALENRSTVQRTVESAKQYWSAKRAVVSGKAGRGLGIEL